LFQPTSVVMIASRGSTSRTTERNALGPHREALALHVLAIAGDELGPIGCDLADELVVATPRRQQPPATRLSTTSACFSR
jgi:hypothetical protein